MMMMMSETLTHKCRFAGSRLQTIKPTEALRESDLWM